ncbi:MAG: cobalt ECF transporter T component CbiQ [Alphaproteobacteria bacterium]
MRHAFADRYSDIDSPIHRLDARTKIITLLSLIVVNVSTPPNAFGAFGGYLAVILAVILLSRVPLGYVFFRSLVVIPFVLMVAAFVPFLKGGGGSYSLGVGGLRVSQSGLMVLWNTFVKSYIAVLSMIALSSTTPFPQLLRGLEQLGAPKLCVMLASFTYRYIFVLVEEAERMKRARDARCYGGRWLWHAKVIGQMIGTLFLRSYERGERVYVAMVARGFDGRIVGFRKTRLATSDYVFALLALAGVFVLRTAAIWSKPQQ